MSGEVEALVAWYTDRGNLCVFESMETDSI